jgi:hypothetical protein
MKSHRDKPNDDVLILHLFTAKHHFTKGFVSEGMFSKWKIQIYDEIFGFSYLLL